MAYDSVGEAKTPLGAYLAFYNTRRPHRAFDGRTPDAIYFAGLRHEGGSVMHRVAHRAARFVRGSRHARGTAG